MLRARGTLAVSLVITMLAASCGDDGGSSAVDSGIAQDTGGGADAAAGSPEATFDGMLDPYSVASGADYSVKVKASAAVTKVELLVDGSTVASSDSPPFTLTWDTTKAKDGLAKLKLKAYAASTSVEGAEELPVMVLNNGSEATFDEGADHTMTINPAADSHLKVHWTMPANVKKVIGLLTFDNASFKMRLDVGTGGCPHSGQTAATATSESSPAVVEFDGKGSNLGTVMWFLHAAAENEASLEGETCKTTFKAFLIE
jgi:hypothetical protein